MNTATTTTTIDKQCTNVYNHVRNNDGAVDKSFFMEFLASKGILKDDPRIADFISISQQHSNLLDNETFINCIKKNINVIEAALTHSHVIPSFESFTKDIKTLYESVLLNTDGNVTTDVPHLPNHNEEHFGISVCTVDGQRFNIGDSMVDFCIHSCSKPVNYCLACDECGMDKIHKHVGREPSGIAHNALKLDSNGLPHNPLINSGGIMICSLIKNHLNANARFEYIINMWKKLAGGKPLSYSKGVYQSERMSGFRNFALAYIMEENKAFPEKANLVQVLENYFKCHSLTIKSNYLAIVGATLANGGVCPLTKEKVLSTETVKNCLSTMYSCGMYDYSGEFAFKIGLPASSSGTGGLFVVIPNVMSICVYSPRLDKYGNSVRGVEFFTRLTEQFNFHLFDYTMILEKKNPLEEGDIDDMTVEKIIKCSGVGDVGALRRLRVTTDQLTKGDYDRRTPLHLAASNGHLDLVKYIYEIVGEKNINPVDRWGGTPFDDAMREENHEVALYLESVGGMKGEDLVDSRR